MNSGRELHQYLFIQLKSLSDDIKTLMLSHADPPVTSFDDLITLKNNVNLSDPTTWGDASIIIGFCAIEQKNLEIFTLRDGWRQLQPIVFPGNYTHSLTFMDKRSGLFLRGEHYDAVISRFQQRMNFAVNNFWKKWNPIFKFY